MIRTITSLETGYDLNALRVEGWYGVSSPGNAPAAASTYFIRVLHAPIDGISRIMQIAHRKDGKHSSTRSYTDTGWSDWLHTSPAHENGLSVDVKYFINSATWTKPVGLLSINVRIIGGGGAGGDAAATTTGNISFGSGGGSGSETFMDIVAASLAATVAVTVGAAGDSEGTPAGGTSSFGGHVTASGGNAGSTLASGSTPELVLAASAGALGNGGNLRTPERSGDYGIRLSGTVGVGGKGADSSMGPGGRSRSGNTGAGEDSGGKGAGGSGAFSTGASAFTQSGGAGGQGIVIVTEYF